jgi:hypothetical protein
MYAGLAALLAAGPVAATRTDAADAPEAERSGRFRFSLLPKSLQRRPSLDFHVITELTAEGRKLAPPSATNPVYYIAQPGQFTQLGTNILGGETPPDVESLTRAMEAALAGGHSLKASPSTPLPAIAVVFNYGSFARFSMELHDWQEDQALAELSQAGSIPAGTGPMIRSEDRDTEALLAIVVSNRMERDEVLQRAGIIGGEKFSRDLAKALNEEVLYRAGGDNALGFAGIGNASPFHLFANANEQAMMLVEDSFNGCYFVIASAFDYLAMRRGQRVLLWRTKMSVNSSGINMSESLPPLVHIAGPYLGKEMPDAVTLTRRISRDGKVRLGELRVLETDVPLPGAATADPKRAPAPTPSPDPAAKP